MKQPQTSLPAWLPEPLRQDPKRTGVLGVLVLVLVLVMLRWALMGQSPAVARAELRPPLAPEKDRVPKKKNLAETPVASGPTREWLKTPLQGVSRNLFALRHEFFPHVAGKSDNLRNTGAGGGDAPSFWDAIQKSRDRAADQKRRREILVDNLQREAAKLRLQSTVMGPEPQAIIGGSLVKEGDSVAASDASSIQFRVLKIEARRVVIEREGIKLEVRMAQ